MADDDLIETTESAWWLDTDGQLREFTRSRDASGKVFSTGGKVPPPGTELDSDGVTEVLRERLHAERDAFNAAEREMVAVVQGQIEARAAKVEELIGYGLTAEAAEALTPEAPQAYVPQAYVVSSTAVGKYGLTRQQVESLLI